MHCLKKVNQKIQNCTDKNKNVPKSIKTQVIRDIGFMHALKNFYVTTIFLKLKAKF